MSADCPHRRDAETNISIRCKTESDILGSGAIQKAWADTWSLFKAAFGNRFPIEQKRVAMPFSTNIDVSSMLLMGCQPFSISSEASHESGSAATAKICELIPFARCPSRRSFSNSMLVVI